MLLIVFFFCTSPSLEKSKITINYVFGLVYFKFQTPFRQVESEVRFYFSEREQLIMPYTLLSLPSSQTRQLAVVGQQHESKYGHTATCPQIRSCGCTRKERMCQSQNPSQNTCVWLFIMTRVLQSMPKLRCHVVRRFSLPNFTPGYRLAGACTVQPKIIHTPSHSHSSHTATLTWLLNTLALEGARKHPRLTNP